MATKRRKTSKKTSKRKSKKGLRGLSKIGMGKKVGLFLTSVLAGNLAHEGLYQLSKLGFMQSDKPVVEGTSRQYGGWKPIVASSGLFVLSGGLSAWTNNEWVNALATGAGIGSSIHLKDEVVLPAIGLGAVDDFLDLYRTDEPLKDLKGLKGPEERITLAGLDPNSLMKKLA